LVRNALALFLGQSLRHGDTAHLVILDDANQIDIDSGASGPLSWEVIPLTQWIPLPKKYSELVRLAGPCDAFACWDDDDVYLPWHLAAIADVLDMPSEWSHPSHVWSTYQRDPLTQWPVMEYANGRFHGALAVRREALTTVNGWPDTMLATYDQQMISNLVSHFGPPGNPCMRNQPSYVYRWGDTQRHHASGSIDERGEYRKPPIQEQVHIEHLTPQLDASASALLAKLKPKG